LSEEIYQFKSFDKKAETDDAEDNLNKDDDKYQFKSFDFEKISNDDSINKDVDHKFPFPSFDLVENEVSEQEKIIEKQNMLNELEEKISQANTKIIEADDKIKKAESVIEDAQQKGVQIEKSAYENGYSKGLNEAKAGVIQKADPVIERLENAIRSISDYKNDFPKIYEKEIIGLIKQISERVIHINSKVDKKVVMENILACFEILADRVEVKISINSEDMDFVNEHKSEFFTRIKGLKSVLVEADADIGLGGCRIETLYGNVDARVEEQLKKIDEAIESVTD